MLVVAGKGRRNVVCLVCHGDGDPDVGGTLLLAGCRLDEVGLLGALLDVEVEAELVAAVANDTDLIAAAGGHVAPSPPGRLEEL
ncbi:hypothetical protein CTA1_12964 [Colletotrichum tanaceti]|uniref:Uncharacterized protein n=1 Tax=Colletotrichum tanaceti TaxID=1306861 RepID=A0A4U6WYL2_9PEZI|nr:hypothetical protein CTA1_12964 [Colletotrichum tanaceti]